MRKYTTILFTALLLSSFFTYGQETSFKPWNVGLKINTGFNWLNVRMSEDLSKSNVRLVENSNLRTHFSYGLFYNKFWSENFGWGVEFRHSLQGHKYNTTSAIADTTFVNEYTLRSQQLEFPVRLNIQTNEFGYSKIGFSFGLVPGFNINTYGDEAITKSPAASSGNLEKTDVNFYDNVNLINLGFEIGANYQYNLGKNLSVFGGIAFNNGFLRFIDRDEVERPFSAVPKYISLNTGLIF
jgi:hypothetical protein